MRPTHTIILLAGLSTAATAGVRPNFLVIAVDDLNHFTSRQLAQPDNFLRRIYADDATVADVGRRLAPNLERLASQSLSFTRAYCPSALCGPSRTALMTGLPPHVSGYLQHHDHFRHNPALREIVTLPQYLKANGYTTVGLGKVFHRPAIEDREGVRHDWPDADFSWSRWIERRIGSAESADRDVDGERTSRDGGARRTPSPYSPGDVLFSFGRSHVPTERTHDFVNARFAATLLARGRGAITDLHGHGAEVVLPPGEPFLLGLGLFLPHLPWFVPQEFIDRFPVEEMRIDADLVKWVTDDVSDLPDGTARQWLGKDFDSLVTTGEKLHGPGGVTHAWRAALQHYLGSIAFADHCLGQVVAALEESPYRDNTVLMLWGDHGWNLGDKRRFRKQALWEGANHTTFIWRDPDAPAGHSGKTCHQLVSLQDIYPTVAARAGLPIPAHVHGRDLAPLLADPETTEWENQLLFTYNAGNHALRTLTHRYIRYRDGGRELYDLRADPWEFSNLAGQTAHADLQAGMERRLDEHLARVAGDYRD